MADVRPSMERVDVLAKPVSRPSNITAVRRAVPVAGSGLLGAWLFASGLTGVWLLQLFLVGRENTAGAAYLGVQRFAVLSWVLALGGAMIFALAQNCAPWQNLRTRGWVTAYAGVFMVMLCRGLLNTAVLEESGWVSWVAGQLQASLLFLAPLVLIPCGGRLLRSRPFQLTVALHASVGGLLGLGLVLRYGLSNRLDYLDRDFGLNLVGGVPYYAVGLALLLWPLLPKLLKAGVAGGAVGLAVGAITFQGRITSVVLVCTGIALIVGMLRARRRGGRGNAMLLVGAGVGLVILAGVALRTENLASGIEALGARWQGKEGTVQTVTQDSRYDEAAVVSSQMLWLDWAVGKGLGATWSDPNFYLGETRSMVHFGYLHFLFIGGVGLWWLCCIAPLVSAARCWRLARGTEYAAVAYVLIRSIELFGYGVPHFSPVWLLTCVCLGAVQDAASRRGRAVADSGPTDLSSRG